MTQNFFANLKNLSEEDLNLLSGCILLKLEELNKTENKYNYHLKESFFEEKRRLLFIHRNVCELLQCFEYNTIAEDHTRIFNK